jgi:hypothetical protein
MLELFDPFVVGASDIAVWILVVGNEVDLGFHPLHELGQA